MPIRKNESLRPTHSVSAHSKTRQGSAKAPDGTKKAAARAASKDKAPASHGAKQKENPRKAPTAFAQPVTHPVSDTSAGMQGPPVPEALENKQKYQPVRDLLLKTPVGKHIDQWITKNNITVVFDPLGNATQSYPDGEKKEIHILDGQTPREQAMQIAMQQRMAQQLYPETAQSLVSGEAGDFLVPMLNGAIRGTAAQIYLGDQLNALNGTPPASTLENLTRLPYDLAAAQEKDVLLHFQNTYNNLTGQNVSVPKEALNLAAADKAYDSVMQGVVAGAFPPVGRPYVEVFEELWNNAHNQTPSGSPDFDFDFDLDGGLA